MSENICHFVATRYADESINIINFVYEKEANFKQEYILTSAYSLCLVTAGSGVLHTSFGEFTLGKGDLFFVFSAKPYYIENTDKLQYIYISFLGARILALLERLQILKSAPVYSGFEHLIPNWEDAFAIATEENVDLLCEGLLLHALSKLCRKKDEIKYSEKQNGILLVKRYVDLHFTDRELNLSTVSSRFSYSPKYLSAAFKKLVRIGFSQYLSDRRLEYAVSLINCGIENVSELADMCGYSDATYFSKAFKEKYKLTPKKYIDKSFICLLCFLASFVIVH